jgi:hypothetical protein
MLKLCFNLAAQTLYGVQLNLDPSSLLSDWSLCLNEPYPSFINSVRLNIILTLCNKNKLLLGCRPVGNKVLTVAAMGNRTDVLYNCSSTPSCTKVANGVGWYYSSSYSWGFVSGNDPVTRHSCDTHNTSEVYRLCWHTQSGTGGGYRCGVTKNANASWEKIIYHAN